MAQNQMGRLNHLAPQRAKGQALGARTEGASVQHGAHDRNQHRRGDALIAGVGN
jgi:hypothetical protein